MKLGTIVRLSAAVASAVHVSGCIPSLKTPERLYSVEEESKNLKDALDNPKLSWLSYASITDVEQQKVARNNIIAARMYAIDIQYTKYEAALTHEAQQTDFAAKAANLALTGTATLIPVAHTTRMLNGIATGISSLDDAYNEKVLRAQLIQNIQAAMRIARHDQAAVIYANMKCSTAEYPLPMALSDLEAYYRAGTTPAGIIKLSQTVTKAEADSKANEDSQKPANPVAQATLAGNAVVAALKVDAAKDQSKGGCFQQAPALMRLQAQIKELQSKIDKQLKTPDMPQR